MKRSTHLPTAAQSPRRVRLDDGVLVLPPVSMGDLPPDGVIGSFRGVAALRFVTAAGPIAVFLHDLNPDDLGMILETQRREAEAQLGNGYARRALWWEKP
jgi:hypothetical protein